jgi:hypothetical protein
VSDEVWFNTVIRRISSKPKRKTRLQAGLAYRGELNPITPVVSSMAWGLRRETEPAGTAPFPRKKGALFRILHPIYKRKRTSMPMSDTFSPMKGKNDHREAEDGQQKRRV